MLFVSLYVVPAVIVVAFILVMASVRILREYERAVVCENAPNRDPTPEWFTALILFGNRGMQRGSCFARSATPLKSGIHSYIQ
jgi:hypothetical protein